MEEKELAHDTMCASKITHETMSFRPPVMVGSRAGLRMSILAQGHSVWGIVET